MLCTEYTLMRQYLCHWTAILLAEQESIFGTMNTLNFFLLATAIHFSSSGQGVAQRWRALPSSLYSAIISMIKLFNCHCNLPGGVMQIKKTNIVKPAPGQIHEAIPMRLPVHFLLYTFLLSATKRDFAKT